MDSLLAAIEALPLSRAIAEGDYWFPLLEVIHVIAITLVVGTVGLVDLRLVGAIGPGISPARLMRTLLPWTWGMFVVAAISGGLLFASSAERYWEIGWFRAKFILMALAGLNMLVFHFTTGRHIPDDRDAVMPGAAKIAGFASILLWIGVVTCGRWVGFS